MGLAIYEKEPNITWVNYKFIEQRIDAQYYKREFVENEIKLKQIKNLPLKELYTRGDYGTLPDSADYSEKGIYLIRGTDLRDLSIKEDDLILVPEEYFSDKSEVKSEDILILIKGATIDAEWSVSIVPKINYKAIFNGSIFRIRLKKEYDPYFVTAFMSTKYFLYQKKRAISNTGIYYNDKESIENFIISIPSPEIQKYIGDKVRKAEELREEAKRLKKEAEGIIYKELNFGSLEDKLKIINNKYTWVGLHNLGIRIDSKYYNEKVLRIKDYFNKHYETIKLKECLQYCSRGKSFAESSEDGIILIKTKNLNNSFINYERNFVYEKEVNNNLILKEKDLIFASMGVGSLGKIDMYYPSEEKATIDGTLMLLRFKSDSKLNPEYVMEFLRTHIGQKLIYQNVVGSTGIISISVDDLINIDIPYIDDEKQEKISNFTNKYLTDIYASKRLIQEAKQDVEDLIEGNFDMSKIKAHSKIFVRSKGR